MKFQFSGHVTPVTQKGKIALIFYAVIGKYQKYIFI